MKTKQIFLSVVLGVFFWLSAALIVRYVGTLVFTAENPYLILFYLLGIPITGGFLLIIKLIIGISYADMLKPIVVMTITATLLDGVALAWFRPLYSSSFEVALHGAAWILWGAGLGLLAAFVLNARGNEVNK